MKKALLLEDDQCCREVMTEVLNDFGIEVEAYEDPSLYFKRTNQCPGVDVILTDNHMPNMTGIAFLQRIGEMQCDIPSTKQAVISGGLTSEDFARVKELGIKYFQKPYRIEEIRTWLNEIGIISKHCGTKQKP